MSKLFIKYCWVLVFIIGSGHLFAQSSKDLIKQRERIQNKINYTNKLLSETTQHQRISQTQLVLLNTQIAFREEKISAVNYEIRKLDEKMEENASIIEAMEHDLESLKAHYAQMIMHAYKNRNDYDQLIYIFSAASFNQAYRRLKYMQQYAAARKKQAKYILATQDMLNDKIAELDARKQERQQLLQVHTDERGELSEDRVKQQETLSHLQQEESTLRTQLKRQEKDKERLDAAIQHAIAEEIRKAKAKNKEKGVFSLTPAEKIVSSNFEKNKGGLPWPVETGVITSTFGKHPHPVIPGYTVNNNGIDIATGKGSNVRAVFEGEVTSVIVIPGAGKAVIIGHGAYRTVYSNLQEVVVKKGDKVKMKQKLGSVLTNTTNNKTEAHFEIWKISGEGVYKRDPVPWIAKNN